MKTEPRDVDDATIAAELEDGWEIDRVHLRYAPLGFGSHHWIATIPSGQRWFVTADDLCASHLGPDAGAAFTTLETAFRTAVSLREEANLSFVVAPVRGVNGEILRRLSDRYTIAVFPYLDLEPNGLGEFRIESDRDEAMRLVAHVHSATHSVPVTMLRRDALAIQQREGLLQALRCLDEPWTGGPFSEPARQLLRAHAVTLQNLLERFDGIAGSVTRDTSNWVVTHGEPHAANVVRTTNGDLVMVDWDTVAFGPRERDLWMLVDEARGDWDAYRDVTGVQAISHDAISAYRLHWSLSEIATYTAWFRRAHERTDDTGTAWEQLREYVRDLG